MVSVNAVGGQPAATTPSMPPPLPLPQDNHWRRRWEAASDEILSKLVPSSTAGPELAFVGDRHGEYLEPMLEHLACFWPGESGSPLGCLGQGQPAWAGLARAGQRVLAGL
jgi:hypothetical protein